MPPLKLVSYIYRSIFSWFVSGKHWFSFEETSSQSVAETWFSPMDWLMFLWTVRVGSQDPNSTTKVCISVMKTMVKSGLDMWRARTTNKSFAEVVWNIIMFSWHRYFLIHYGWLPLPCYQRVKYLLTIVANTVSLCVLSSVSWKISCASRTPRCASTTSTTNVDLPPCACKGGPWNIGGRCWQDEFFPRFTGGEGVVSNIV